MSDIIETNEQAANTVKCKNCGANLKFAPGTNSLTCEYCHTENIIEVEKTDIIENDYESFINEHAQNSEEHSVSTVKCESCGANTTLPENVASSNCPYCDTPLVIKNASTSKIIKPQYLLPFKYDKNKAHLSFEKWVNGLWFAPTKLKIYAKNSTEKLKGVYMPYWTYDANTESDYTGMKGVYYYITETYRDGNGNTQTRQVQRVAWYPASGHVSNDFDDVLICSSKSLPQQMVQDLEPWDLPELVKYNDEFLAGFITETYQVEIKQGFEMAKIRMNDVITQTVKSDIGGDLQQVHSLNTEYNHITFKHILLPLYISAYKFNNKVYRFTINARTGEVQGERPYSALKIALLVLGIIAAGLLIWYFSKGNTHVHTHLRHNPQF
ncbi:MAG: hypothetical protein JSU07_06055 [Bacteroidetes bacterium]|nr:hypothetical protein [Bacteroidota bacterium]